jgi:hypothetical protein
MPIACHLGTRRQAIEIKQFFIQVVGAPARRGEQPLPVWASFAGFTGH